MKGLKAFAFQTVFGMALLCFFTLGMGMIAAPEVGASSYTFSILDDPNTTLPQDGANGAFGINNSSQITGTFTDNSGRFGYLYSGGTFTTLSDPSAGPGLIGSVPYGTAPYGINNLGQVSGVYDECPACTEQGFLYSGGTYATLHDPSSIATHADGINDLGQIVGNYNGISTSTGFLDNGGVYTDLNVPFVNANSGATTGTGITNAGLIVGTWADTSNVHHGFIDNGGTFTSFDFSGASATYLNSINNLNQIAGDYYYNGTEYGFVYDYNSSTFLYGGTLGSGLVSFSGAVSTAVSGINDLGQIVGTWLNTSGDYQGFVGTPVPEPAALLLLGSGLVGLAGWARWRQAT